MIQNMAGGSVSLTLGTHLLDTRHRRYFIRSARLYTCWHSCSGGRTSFLFRHEGLATGSLDLGLAGISRSRPSTPAFSGQAVTFLCSSLAALRVGPRALAKVYGAAGDTMKTTQAPQEVSYCDTRFPGGELLTERGLEPRSLVRGCTQHQSSLQERREVATKPWGSTAHTTVNSPRL